MACGGCNGKKVYFFVKQYQLIFIVIQLRLTKKIWTCQVKFKKIQLQDLFEGYKFIGQSGILKIREKLDIELKSTAKIKL